MGLFVAAANPPVQISQTRTLAVADDNVELDSVQPNLSTVSDVVEPLIEKPKVLEVTPAKPSTSFVCAVPLLSKGKILLISIGNGIM